MDRRTFMGTSLGAVAAGCAMPWWDRYGVFSESRAAALVLRDSALRASREYAAAAAGEGIRCLDLDADVGMAWHRRLRDWPGSMRGVLRPSDCFVLRHLAIADARAFRSVAISAGAVGFEIGAV
ncbi:MAG: hypothetical protein ACTHKH_20850 [Trinickia sp.]